MPDYYEILRPQTRQSRTALTISATSLFLVVRFGSGKSNITVHPFDIDIPYADFLPLLTISTLYFLMSFVISYVYDKTYLEEEKPLAPLQKVKGSLNRVRQSFEKLQTEDDEFTSGMYRKLRDVHRNYDNALDTEMNAEGVEANKRATYNECRATMNKYVSEFDIRQLSKHRAERIDDLLAQTDAHIEEATIAITSFKQRFRGISNLKNNWLEFATPVTGSILVLLYAAITIF